MPVYKTLFFLLLLIVLTTCSTEVGNLASTVDLNSAQGSYDEDAGSGTIDESGESSELLDTSEGTPPIVYPISKDTGSRGGAESGAIDLKQSELRVDLNNSSSGSYRIEADFSITGNIPPAGLYSLNIKDGSGNIIGVLRFEITAEGEISAVATVVVSKPDETIYISWPEGRESAFSNSGLYLTGLRIYDLNSGTLSYNSGESFSALPEESPFNKTPEISPLTSGTTTIDSNQSGVVDLKSHDLMLELNNRAAGTFRVELDLKISGEQPAAGNYIISIKDAAGQEVGTLKISIDEKGYISSSTTIAVTDPNAVLYLSWANSNNSNFAESNIYIKGIRIFEESTNVEGYNSGSLFTSELGLQSALSESSESLFSSTPTISSTDGAVDLKTDSLQITMNNSKSGSARIEVDFQVSGTIPPAGKYEVEIRDGSGTVIAILRLEVTEQGKVTGSTTVNLANAGEVLTISWPEGSENAFSGSELYLTGLRIYDTETNSEVYNSGTTLSTLPSSADESGDIDKELSLLELFGTTPDFLALAIGSGSYGPSSMDSVNLKYNDLVVDVNNKRAGKYKIEIDFKVSGNIDKNETYRIDITDKVGESIGFIILKIRKKGTIMAMGHVTLEEPDERIVISWESAKGNKKKSIDELADLEITGIRLFAKRSDLK